MTGMLLLFCLIPACFMVVFTTSVRAFVELMRYLFTFLGVRYFLSEKICQDPLEKLNFFGCQWQGVQALRVCGNLTPNL